MKRFAVMVCISFILIPILGSITFAYREETRSYLVEINLPTLVDYWKNISKNKQNEEHILFYKENLTKIHDRIKELIRNKVGEVKFREFYRVFNGLNVEIPPRLVPLLEKLPFVRNVIPDVKVKVLLKDSIPLVGIDEVWRIKNLTGRNVKIAVIDTGIDYSHPDLSNCYAGGYDFVNDDNDPYDDNGHGTHVCGILAGNGSASNGTYKGVAPNAKLYVYKALDRYGSGFISDIIDAIERAIDPNGDLNFSDHPDILSLSLGITSSFSTEGDPNDQISMAADRAVDVGVVVIAAAGNDGWNRESDSPIKHTIYSPACARKVIAVGASTHLSDSIPSGGPDHVAKYSSKGPSKIMTLKPDVVAPGGDVNIYLEQKDPNRYNFAIVSTRASQCRVGKPVDNHYVKLGGTSMAAPHVSGIVALLLEEHPDWDPFEIRAALRYTAKDLGYPMTYQGFGRVDAYKLINLSSPPPVAIIFDSIEEINRLLIRGVAKSRDFSQYQLYCKYLGQFNPNEFDRSGEWKLIYTSYREVDDGLLCEWNISNYREGWYLVKLVVRDGQNRYSDDYMIVEVRNRKYSIILPEKVYEGEEFHVKITDEHGMPVRAIVMMSSPFRLPRFRIGDDVVFKAYEIRNDKISRIKVGIWVIIPDSGRISLERKEIAVFNR